MNTKIEAILENLNSRGEKVLKCLVKEAEGHMQVLNSIPTINLECMGVKKVQQYVQEDFNSHINFFYRTTLNFVNLATKKWSYAKVTEYKQESELPKSKGDIIIKTFTSSDSVTHKMYYKFDLKMMDLINYYVKTFLEAAEKAYNNIYPNLNRHQIQKYNLYNWYYKPNEGILKEINNCDLRKLYIEEPLKIFGWLQN